MHSFADELEKTLFGTPNPKTIAKKKLNEYYDRFGENPWDIEYQIPDEEYQDYCSVRCYAGEVLKERATARELERQESLMQRNTTEAFRADMAERKQQLQTNDLRAVSGQPDPFSNQNDDAELIKISEEEKGLTSSPFPPLFTPEVWHRMSEEGRISLEKEWKERAAQEKEQRRLFETDKAIQKHIAETKQKLASMEIKGEQKESLRFVDNYLSNDFYNLLAQKESSNNYNAFNSEGGGIGALGKYQMRKGILIDLGYVDKQGNWLGKDGINSAQDFYNAHEVQEKAIKDMMNLNYIRLKRMNLLPQTTMHVKAVLNKQEVDFDITLSGLLAAGHREGLGFVRTYFKSLEKDKNGVYRLPYDKIEKNLRGHLYNVEKRLYDFCM